MVYVRRASSFSCLNLVQELRSDFDLRINPSDLHQRKSLSKEWPLLLLLSTSRSDHKQALLTCHMNNGDDSCKQSPGCRNLGRKPKAFALRALTGLKSCQRIGYSCLSLAGKGISHVTGMLDHSVDQWLGA